MKKTTKFFLLGIFVSCILSGCDEKKAEETFEEIEETLEDVKDLSEKILEVEQDISNVLN